MESLIYTFFNLIDGLFPRFWLSHEVINIQVERKSGDVYDILIFTYRKASVDS
jgi:hypothetical protein